MSSTTTLTRPERSGPTPDDRALLECGNLVRIFQADGIEVQALQGLDLRVERGELVAVVGASGSGKSTLLGILSGLDMPTAGQVRVGSWDLTTMTRAQRVAYRRRTVGFVWQQTARNLLPYLTAEQNVRFPQAVAGVPRAERHVRAGELLEMLGVADCARRRPEELSGGQQQRVAIAVALANGPELLLADEPTGELDTVTTAEVLGTLRAANAELGTTVLIVTHDADVSEHVRRTIAIRDGRTSSEVVRTTRTRDDGTEHTVAEEFAVLDRAGRVQLPREYREALDLVGRVRLALEDHQVTVRSGREE